MTCGNGYRIRDYLDRADLRKWLASRKSPIGLRSTVPIPWLPYGMHIQTRAQLPAQPTIKQTADYFGVDTKTIRRWISQGRLTAYRVGPRLIRVDRESILKLASPIGGAA